MKLEDLTPDKYQRSIIDDFTPERTIVVTGVAGSGKSLTLLKKPNKSPQYRIHTLLSYIRNPSNSFLPKSWRKLILKKIIYITFMNGNIVTNRTINICSLMNVRILIRKK